MKFGWQILPRWLLRRGGLWLVVSCLTLPTAGADSLDEILSCLETNGVLVDRSEAVSGGLKGILRSIDPEAVIGEAKPQETGSTAGGRPVSVVQAVELWPENLAYLKVSGLESGSGEEILSHLKSMSARWGVLFDLRGGRGEDLESACVLAGMVRHQHEPLFIITDNRGGVLATNTAIGTFTRVPLLMILIDGETGGASEALVSVLKGGPGVILVGTATGGDPYLRHWLSLPGGRMARLAMRKWVPFSGEKFEKVGVSPDIVATAVSGIGNEGLASTNRTDRTLSLKSDADRELMMRVAGDAAMQRATDILLGLQALGGYGRE